MLTQHNLPKRPSPQHFQYIKLLKIIDLIVISPLEDNLRLRFQQHISLNKL